jgi:hypothetical protein
MADDKWLLKLAEVLRRGKAQRAEILQKSIKVTKPEDFGYTSLCFILCAFLIFCKILFCSRRLANGPP